jgi:hypothetical protein
VLPKTTLQAFAVGAGAGAAMALLSLAAAGAGHGNYIAYSLTHGPLQFLYSRNLPAWVFGSTPVLLAMVSLYWGCFVALSLQSRFSRMWKYTFVVWLVLYAVTTLLLFHASMFEGSRASFGSMLNRTKEVGWLVILFMLTYTSTAIVIFRLWRGR